MNFSFSSLETQRRKEETRRRLLRPMARYPILRWLMAGIAAVLFVAGMGKLHEFRHIQQAGVKTQGVLLSIVGAPGKKANITYSFSVGDHQYTGTTEVGAQDRLGLHTGDAIEVRYLAENPTQNLTAVSWPSAAYGQVLFSVLTICSLLTMLWQIRKEHRKGVRL